MLDKLKLRGVYIVTICMSTANLVNDKKGKKMTEFSQTFAMPNKDTLSIKPIREFAEKWVNKSLTLNKIKDVEFALSPALSSISAVTGSMLVEFVWPVTVTGNPTITVANNQAGGGSVASFSYTYKSGTGTNVLQFEHNHGPYPANNGGFSANVLSIGVDLVATGASVFILPFSLLQFHQFRLREVLNQNQKFVLVL